MDALKLGFFILMGTAPGGPPQSRRSSGLLAKFEAGGLGWHCFSWINTMSCPNSKVKCVVFTPVVQEESSELKKI